MYGVSLLQRSRLLYSNDVPMDRIRQAYDELHPPSYYQPSLPAQSAEATVPRHLNQYKRA